MRGRSYYFIGALVFLFAGPAIGQDATAPSDQAPIIVEGHRNADAEIRDLINSLPPAPANGHISRFEHTACPAVLGIPIAQRAIVAARIRTVGTAAGVPMGNATCRPNVLVMVTSNKQQLIEQLERHFPDYLGELGAQDIHRLKQSAEPTALWYLSGTVDADGRQQESTSGSTLILRTTRNGSRIIDQAHSEFIGSVLVIEARALVGLTTTQVADYAAMRAFTGADPERLTDRSLATILTLLDAPMGSEVPVTLTSWDLSFLQSLYASNANIHAPGQRGEIQDGMRRGVERAADRQERHQ